MATDNQEAAQSFRLRVANLAWETEDANFKNFFAEFKPTEAVIIRRKRTGRSRGYGFVNFDNEESMNAALAKDGQKLDDREIKIAVSTSKGPYPEGSKRPRTETKRSPKKKKSGPVADGAADDSPKEERQTPKRARKKGGKKPKQEDEPKAEEVPPSAARLIVQRLGWEIDDEALAKKFGEFGAVASAKVIKNRRSGRSRGYGFVTFENEADGQKALESLNGNEELGFTPQKGKEEDAEEPERQGIKVLQATSQGPRKRPQRQRKRRTNDGDKSQDKKDKPGPRRLFVRNLGEDTTEESLTDAFKGYGEVKNVRIVNDRETGKPNGIAFVTFVESAAFTEALAAFEAGGKIGDADVEVKRALPSRFIRNRNRRFRKGGRGGGRGGGKPTAGGDGGTATSL